MIDFNANITRCGTVKVKDGRGRDDTNCKFPFVYKDHTYHQCTQASLASGLHGVNIYAWCDINDDHSQNQKCDTDCKGTDIYSAGG